MMFMALLYPHFFATNLIIFTHLRIDTVNEWVHYISSRKSEFHEKIEKIMLHNPIGRGIEVIPQYQIIDICWGRFILGLPHYEVFKRLNQ